MNLPELFKERLKLILPPDAVPSVLDSFERPKLPTLRWNPLKVSSEEVDVYFQERGWQANRAAECPETLLLDTMDAGVLSDDPWVLEGKLYIQDMSSLLPVIVLDPKPNEKILDMCAAPGSKTTQIAARMLNQGELVAIERVRDRFFRLKNILERHGVSCAEWLCMDARRYQLHGELFDRILVDAPCSSEGRFYTQKKNTMKYWSLRKIREMAKKQKGLLMSAMRLLKPGGTMVYSTCTFAPEENERSVEWLLKKFGDAIMLQDIRLPEAPTYPSLRTWGKKEFSEDISKTMRVLPNNRYSPFFIAKFLKKT